MSTGSRTNLNKSRLAFRFDLILAIARVVLDTFCSPASCAQNETHSHPCLYRSFRLVNSALR